MLEPAPSFPSSRLVFVWVQTTPGAAEPGGLSETACWRTGISYRPKRKIWVRRSASVAWLLEYKIMPETLDITKPIEARSDAVWAAIAAVGRTCRARYAKKQRYLGRK